MFPASKQAVAVLEETKWVRITESRISTVFAMLPTSLQSRIVPGRRSNSLQNIQVKNLDDEALTRSRPLSEADALVITNDRMVTEVCGGEDVRSTKAPPLPPRSPSSSSSSGSSSTSYRSGNDGPSRAASGIHWRFARQGINLVDHFVGNGQPATSGEDSTFERKAYIDGLTYLLRGLPGDLEPYEVQQVRSALPAALSCPESAGAVEGRPQARTKYGKQRSLLHRAVQASVIYIIFFFHFILPYLLLCFKFMARLERKHKVSERIVGHGMNFANAAGRRGAYLTESLCGMNDSRVGKALSELAAWTVDGVTRGISDGVGEGLVVVGVTPSL